MQSLVQNSAWSVEENERFAIELLVNQKTKDAHHGSTALVELLQTKIQLFRLAGVIDVSNWEGRSREIPWEGTFSLLPSGKLQSSAERENLKKTSEGD